MTTLIDIAEAPTPTPMSLEALLTRDSMCARIARHLLAHRGQWIDGQVLSKLGGYAAYRTRISDLRKAPWCLNVENRYRHMKDGDRKWIVSEYRCV